MVLARAVCEDYPLKKLICNVKKLLHQPPKWRHPFLNFGERMGVRGGKGEPPLTMAQWSMYLTKVPYSNVLVGTR